MLRPGLLALLASTLVAFGGACGPAAPATPPATNAASPAASTGSAALEMPGPARGREHEAVIANAACEACHLEEAAGWRASLHRTSDVEPSYRRAFAIEPLPFCRGCHAPEARPEEPESAEVAALGVGCVTCHVTDGAVLAAPWRAASAPPDAPHPITRDARFATEAACARCHEFGFPGTLGRAPHEKMQWTVTEHAQGPAARTTCAGCHMPAGATGRRAHTFAASRDPAMLARAVGVTLERLDDARVRVVLSPRDAGHAFPTGDLFRRVEVLAQVEGPDHLVLASDVRYLGRHFEARRKSAGRHLVRDDRVHGVPVTVDLDVTAAGAGRPIAVRVAYQRVDHPNGTDEEEASVDGEIVLSEAVLPPTPHPTPTPHLPPPRD